MKPARPHFHSSQRGPFAQALAGAVFFLVMMSGIVRADVDIGDKARGHILALLTEKEGRTPAQKKMDSQLIYAVKQKRKDASLAGVPTLKVKVDKDAQDRVLVDIKAKVSQDLLDFIAKSGGAIVSQHPKFNAIRASVPHEAMEALASRDDVRFVQPAVKAFTNASEGDVAHTAKLARTKYADYGANGSGVKVGVMSDGVDTLSTLVGNHTLNPVTVLPGQSGSGDEGTAMINIIQDLAPGATVYFAAAGSNSSADMAQNILDLAAAGCTIIVDDITYPDESPFQDDVIAQAVNTVSDAGVMFFSSAANSGSLIKATSGTWEGDFADGGAALAKLGAKNGSTQHNFGGTTVNSVSIVSDAGHSRLDLFWADPLDASSNDYDVFVVDAGGAGVVYASTTTQTGTQSPYEHIESALTVGQQIIVTKAYGAAARFLHLSTGRDGIQIGTTGSTRGHNASGAANAFCVAATDVRNANGAAFTGGTANPVESYSSDGPRHVFFDRYGNPITTGNFLATGGQVLNKPDFTAADHVTTAATSLFTPPGGTQYNELNPFSGTSAAAPHAAAIAALLRSYNPLLTPAQIRTLLTDSKNVLDIEAANYDINSGSGIIMALASMDAAQLDTTMAGDALAIQFSGLNATGPVGGTFTPASSTFNIINKDPNVSDAAITWTAGTTQPWIALSATSGTVAPGATSTPQLTLSLTAAANTLVQGSYSDTVTFNINNPNPGSAGSYTRTFPVNLTVGTPPASQMLFDSGPNTAGVGLSSSSNVPRQFLADAIHLGANTNPTITSGTAYLVALSSTAYTNIRLNITFWGTASNGTTSTVPAAAAFTNMLDTFSIDMGALTTVNGTYYPFAFALPRTVTLPNNTGGVTMNWQGSTGGGLASSDNLTPAARVGPALNTGTWTAGTAGTNGWYQGNAAHTDGNFSSCFTFFTGGSTNQGLALQLFGTQVQPATATNAATNVTSATATLTGTLNPCGAVSTAQFQYGLDTDYGQTAAVTLTPNNGTAAQTLSASLTGLSPGTTYHFRLVGSNIYGEMDGRDFSFTTTGISVVSPTGGSTAGGTSLTITGTNLGAVTGVSIGGVATTTYTIVNSTTITATIAAHAAGVVDVVLTTAGGTATGSGLYTYFASSVSAGAIWSEQAGSGARLWQCITSSADGTKLAAGLGGGLIYTSTNSGVTWSQEFSSGSLQWQSITSSADGTRLAAVDRGSSAGGLIHVSTDSGADWFGNATAQTWSSITSSFDGSKQAAVVNGGNIWTSANFGSNWTSRATTQPWASIASSSDGKRLAAVVAGGLIYTSPDSGATWTAQTTTPQGWASIASSYDGSRLAAVDAASGAGGLIYTSADSGATWAAQASGSHNWQSITSSADGGSLAAAERGGLIYTSTDSGATWTAQPAAGTRQWLSITSSADGTKLAAVDYGGYIWTSAGTYSAPTVTTPTSASVTATTAVLGGNVTATNGTAITERGVIYAPYTVNSNPRPGGTGVTMVAEGSTTTGVFTVPITGLASGISYGFVAYATNSAGTTCTGPVTYFGTLPIPVISVVSPTGGSTSGGNSVSIIGRNFAGITGVFFDGVAATTYTVVNPQTITATPPAHTVPGVVDVSITSDGPNTATGTGLYTYLTLPVTAGAVWVAQATVLQKQNWQCITSSADGSHLAAAERGGMIYTSADFGVTWAQRAPASNAWVSIASSADGSKLAIVAAGGQIYTSTDSGGTWATRASTQAWSSITSSSDGGRLAATVAGGQIYTSTDSGGTWAPRASAQAWSSIASSSDGGRLAATAAGGLIYTSTDSGGTWTPRTTTAQGWTSIASSYDGSNLAAVDAAGGAGGLIYTSADSGVNWAAQASGSRNWQSIASSADGGTLAAVERGGLIYTSPDFGVNWTPWSVAGTRQWVSIASSADGSKLSAVDYGGYIWTSSGTNSAPTVTTPTSASVLATTATLGGNVTASGGTASLTGRGIIYALTSVNPNPRPGGVGVTTVPEGGTTTGIFTVSVTGLTPSSGHSFVAYATNSVGTTCTSPASTFTTLALPSISVEQPAGTGLASGSTKDFGTVSLPLNSTSSLAFTIKNTGGTDLTGLTTTIDGTNSGDFSVSTGPTAPLTAGSSTTFTVIFTPRDVAARSAVLHIASNDPVHSSFDINLTGIGAANHAPSFQMGADQTVPLGSSAPVSVANWATLFSPGPSYESAQVLVQYIVSNSNPGLFSVQPSITAGGTLTYTPFSSTVAGGTATVTVQVQDNGGTLYGGQDKSTAQTFHISVNVLALANANGVSLVAPNVTGYFLQMNFVPDIGSPVTVVNNTSASGAITGTFSNVPRSTGTFVLYINDDSFTFRGTYTGGTGNDLVITRVESPGQFAGAYEWSNLAGQPGGGGNNDGVTSGARFYMPYGVTADSSGNLYVADTYNYEIRKIGSDGIVSTLAGNGSAANVDGTGDAARFLKPFSVVALNGTAPTLIVSDQYKLRQVDPVSGLVTTLAGGSSGVLVDGTGSSAVLGGMQGVAASQDGSMIYIAEAGTGSGQLGCIRKVTRGGVVTTLAGSLTAVGIADGTGSAARFKGPQGLTVDSTGNVYVADTMNHTIRMVTPAGVVTTIAGLAGTIGSTNSPMRFNQPYAIVCYDDATLYVIDYNVILRKLSLNIATHVWTLSTVAGATGVYGQVDAAGTSARFTSALGLAKDASGNVVIADTFGNAIRLFNPSPTTPTMTAMVQVPPGWVMTIAGSPAYSGSTNGTGTTARFNGPSGVSVDPAGNVLVADYGNSTIRSITPSQVTSLKAGAVGVHGTANSTGTNSLTARFYNPYCLATDSSGNTYISDLNNYTIRKMDPTGIVTTWAGLAGSGGTADGIGTAARFGGVNAIYVNAAGTVVYVIDGWSLRKITPAGSPVGTLGSVTTIATTFTFYEPYGVTQDAAGNVYVAEGLHNAIYKVAPGGTTTIFAGGSLGSADGVGTLAQFSGLSGLAIDQHGNMYVTDGGNQLIRKIRPDATVTTIGGWAARIGGTSGVGPQATFSGPVDVVVNGDGLLFVADANNNRISKGVPLMMPLVTATAPTGVTSSGATLQGTLNPNGLNTSGGAFLYGTSPNALTTTVAIAGSIITNTLGQSVNATVTGLVSGTTYYYALTASNVDGQAQSTIQSFTTP